VVLSRGARALLVFLLCSSYLAAADQSAQLLGFLSLPECLSVTGTNYFSSDHVRRVLARDPEVSSASAPGTVVLDFEQTVERRLVEGLHRLGFIEGRGKARFDAARSNLHVRVFEGPHYGRALISIAGNLSVTTQSLQVVVDAALEGDDGQGLQLDGRAKTRVRHAVEDLYADQGRLRAKTQVSFLPDSKSRLVQVVVDIRDEGPLSRLKSLRTTGVSSVAASAISTFLGAREGSLITGGLLDNWQRRLEQSGRFLSVSLSHEATPGTTDSETVDLQVEPLPDGPGLTEAASPASDALLSLGRWIEGFPGGQDDVLLDFSLPGHWLLKGVLSPHSGVLFSAHRNPPAEPGQWHVRWTPSSFTLVRTHRLQRFHRVVSEGELTVRFRVETQPIGQRADGNFALQAGIGARSIRQANEPLRFDIRVAPVAFLSLGEGEGVTCESVGASVVVTMPSRCFKLHRDTGRLLSMTLRGKTVNGDVSSFPGAFDVLDGVFRRKAERCTSWEPGPGSLSSLGRVLLTVLFRDILDPQCKIVDEKLWELLDEGLVKGLLEKVESMVASEGGDSSREFSIPADARAFTGGLSVLAVPLAWVAAAEGFWPANSWPRVAARALFFLVRGGNPGPYLSQLIESRAIGPMSYFALSRIFSLLDDKLHVAFRRRAAEEFKRTGLRKDIEFVSHSIPFRHACSGALEWLVTCWNAERFDEIRPSLENLFGPHSARLEELIERFAVEPNRPGLDEFLAVVADAISPHLETAISN